MSFLQHAHGEFSATLVPGTAHCGLSYGAGIGNFKYTVEIEYISDEALDHNGFLLDNLTFQDYFQHLEPINVSCEILARRCANDFKKMVGTRTAYVCAVRVAIYPFGDVFVQYEKRDCQQ